MTLLLVMNPDKTIRMMLTDDPDLAIVIDTYHDSEIENVVAESIPIKYTVGDKDYHHDTSLVADQLQEAEENE